jgi:Domain of unknown function (DUF3597)
VQERRTKEKADQQAAARLPIRRVRGVPAPFPHGPSADPGQIVVGRVAARAVLGIAPAPTSPPQVKVMKLLGFESGLQARKEPAQELGYTGDTADPAAMNVWLHKQVMRKLAEKGGKVPDDLRS